MANVDFTDPAWDEVDEGNDITIIADKVSWVELDTRYDTSHVSDSAAHQGISLAGNFTFKFEYQFNNMDTNPLVIIGSAFEVAETYAAIVSNSHDAILFRQYQADFYVRVMEAGAIVGTDSALALTPGTTYFITLDYVVATKTATIEIHTGAHHPGGVHVDLLSAAGVAGVTLADIVAMATMGDDASTGIIDGFIQNLDIGAVGALTASVFDSITVTESVTPQLPLLLADVSDSVTVNESVAPLMPLLLSTLFDSVGVTESITPLMPLLEANVYDSISVSEDVQADIGNWIGINSSHYDSHCGDDGVHTIEKALDGTSYWGENVNETHWFIVDLGTEYNVRKMRARSTGANDPTVVNVYVSNDKENWGDAVASGIDTWQDTTEWAEVDTTDRLGQFVKVEITETEDSINYINFGMPVSHVAIFDIYGVPVALSVSVYDSVSVDEDVSTHLPLLEANVYDSITVSESIEATLPLYEVLEYDSIAVAEDIALVNALLTASLYESISVAEYFKSDISLKSAPVYDSIAVSELVTAYIFSMWTRVMGDNDITWQNPSGSNSVTWRNPTDSNSITWRNV